jgi:hypothetical protein
MPKKIVKFAKNPTDTDLSAAEWRRVKKEVWKGLRRHLDAQEYDKARTIVRFAIDIKVV